VIPHICASSRHFNIRLQQVRHNTSPECESNVHFKQHVNEGSKKRERVPFWVIFLLLQRVFQIKMNWIFGTLCARIANIALNIPKSKHGKKKCVKKKRKRKKERKKEVWKNKKERKK
jgi:hypothetical protein